MAAGVLPQNEQPYSTLVDNTGYATDLKENSERPTPKYTKVGERLRHVIPGPVACSVACGGRACKYENPARWSKEEQAIQGVYSSWVTDSILAMARPSSELLEKYHIIQQFLSHGIKTIINLQRPGEHASCGNALEQESGFTYLPEAFMEAGIYFYNFGWKDYGVASLTTILDMVKVVTFALQEGKVAVHCHAGLGRTGVLIACYLVFATRMTADQAIIFVRAKRPNSIQTRGQLLCVREFTQFLMPLRNVFSCCDPKAHAVTLAQYLIRQRHLLHGYEARLLKHVPKIIHLVCRLLLDVAENRPVEVKDEVAGPRLSAEVEKTVSEMVTMHRDQELLRQGSDVSDPFSPELDAQDAVLSSEQELDPLWSRRAAECLQPLPRLHRRLSYSDSDLQRAEALLRQGEAQDLLGQDQPQRLGGQRPGAPLQQLDVSREALVRNTLSFWSQPPGRGSGKVLAGREDEGASLRGGRDIPKEVHRSRTFSVGVAGACNPGEPVTPSFTNVPEDPSAFHCREPHSRWHPGSAEEERRTSHCPLDRGSGPKAQLSVEREAQDSKDMLRAEPRGELPPELSVEARRVLAARALANLNEFAEKDVVKKKVEMWQKELNSRDGAWERIRGERDPFTLCGLMWSWVEQLKEPVLAKEDVDMLVGRQADAAEALFLLEKGQQQTILCVLHCIVSLQTLPLEVEEACLTHAVKAFTKVNFESENGPIVYSTLKKIFKHTLEEQRKMAQDSAKPGLW